MKVRQRHRQRCLGVFHGFQIPANIALVAKEKHPLGQERTLNAGIQILTVEQPDELFPA